MDSAGENTQRMRPPGQLGVYRGRRPPGTEVCHLEGTCMLMWSSPCGRASASVQQDKGNQMAPGDQGGHAIMVGSLVILLNGHAS